jgi:hypothetical protein
MNTIRYDLAEFMDVIDWVESGGQSDIIPDLMYSPSVAFHADRYDLWLAVVTEEKDEWPEWYISPLLELYSPDASPEKLRRFRSDPRTKAYLEDLGLPEYWRQVGWPDMCQPVGEDDFTCA